MVPTSELIVLANQHVIAVDDGFMQKAEDGIQQAEERFGKALDDYTNFVSDKKDEEMAAAERAGMATLAVAADKVIMLSRQPTRRVLPWSRRANPVARPWEIALKGAGIKIY
jgi:hypothetical protein